MTKPKQKPCPHCQALNNINCKTCKACFASLPLRKRVKNIQKHIEESAWMSNTKKHRNAARVVDSARIAVSQMLSKCIHIYHYILSYVHSVLY